MREEDVVIAVSRNEVRTTFQKFLYRRHIVLIKAPGGRVNRKRLPKLADCKRPDRCTHPGQNLLGESMILPADPYQATVIDLAQIPGQVCEGDLDVGVGIALVPDGL